MSKVFTIADLHFGHEKVALARGFSYIEEHDTVMIENWNRVVTKRDSVFVLGDVVFGEQNLKKLGFLNGTKKLVLGNHDNYPITRYTRYFSKVFGCVRYKGYILSHIPVHENQFERFKGNIHGHLHSKVVTREVSEYNGISSRQVFSIQVDPRYKCVSAEQINLTPIAFEELI